MKLINTNLLTVPNVVALGAMLAFVLALLWAAKEFVTTSD